MAATNTLAGRRDASARSRRGNALSDAERARVLEIQRARILAATVAEVADRGAGHVTVAHIVERAGISRRTFYELFEGRDDCCLAALRDAMERACRSVLAAYEIEAPWVQRIRAGLLALLTFLDAEPSVGRLLVVGSLGGGPEVLEYRHEALERVAEAIDEGRRVAKGGELPPMTAEGVLGGVLSVLHDRMVRDASRPLLGLGGPLMAMIVTPYLGPAAARRELTRATSASAVSRSRRARKARDGDPLQKLGMRLTYRTMCVLSALAARPGVSNRQLATDCEISDQGQVSKLLARLEGIGLIENTERDAPPGSANAWRLTSHGTRIEQALAGTRARAKLSGEASTRTREPA